MGKTCDHTEFEVESGKVLCKFSIGSKEAEFSAFIGQILISKSGNKGFNMAALHVAAHMQEDHGFYFSLSGGDKDTFVGLFN